MMGPMTWRDVKDLLNDMESNIPWDGDEIHVARVKMQTYMRLNVKLLRAQFKPFIDTEGQG